MNFKNDSMHYIPFNEPTYVVGTNSNLVMSWVREQAYMNNYLTQFQNIIEDTLFGAKVKKFGKDPFSSIINPLEFHGIRSNDRS
ncbi:hypothetical protein N9K77_01330 [bacterium]|nr:hypothetical protein [bacterium]